MVTKTNRGRLSWKMQLGVQFDMIQDSPVTHDALNLNINALIFHKKLKFKG